MDPEQVSKSRFEVEVIVRDPHAPVWWASGDARLSRSAHKRIEAELRAGFTPILRIA